MSFTVGDVVWHEAPFKRPESDGTKPGRPWLVVSNDGHPFHGTEYVVFGMTTTDHSEGIEIERRSWVDGRPRKRSYVSPWFAMTLKHADVTHHIGTIQHSVVDSAIDRLVACLGPLE